MPQVRSFRKKSKTTDCSHAAAFKTAFGKYYCPKCQKDIPNPKK